MKVNVNLVKAKPRYVLYFYGQEIVFRTPNFHKKMCWKTFKSAKNYLMENEFIYNGEELNKDNIEIVKLEEIQNER